MIVLLTVGLGFLFKDEIWDLVKVVGDTLTGLIFARVEITKSESPKLLFALYRIIGSEGRTLGARDGLEEPDYVPRTGWYTKWYKGELISIFIGKDTVTVFGLTFMKTIQNFIRDTYQTYFNGETMLTYYLSEGANWNTQIFRRPRNLQVMLDKASVSQKMVLEDIDKFIRSEREYLENGEAYRQGYLLTGAPGIGKSAIVEILAAKYNRPVYLISLNAAGLNDATLINLVSNIPSGGIGVIDEVEKQFEALQNDPTNHVSPAGILSAIDGPQRLAHGVIFILTGNTIGVFENLKESLIRKGRIDKHFQM